MGNHFKAKQTGNLAFNRNGGGCKCTKIGEKVLSLVEAAVTQAQEKLLSSEMNLLNNLCLMGLSIIFCFCAYLYFSLLLPSSQLWYCVLLLRVILSPSLYSPRRLAFSLSLSFRIIARL